MENRFCRFFILFLSRFDDTDHKEEKKEENGNSDSANNIIHGVVSGGRKVFCLFHIFFANFCFGVFCCNLVFESGSSDSCISEKIASAYFIAFFFILEGKAVRRGAVWNKNDSSGNPVQVFVRKFQPAEIVITVI